MATKNPRVVGYISPETHARLKALMSEKKLTESKAVALALSEYFGTNTLTPGMTTDEIQQRLAALEQQMAELASSLGEFAA